ncbi:MAG: periplasmic heavy metal sensor [Deltaproteobacteria bacterium]|nr:MAG: periplasmic heavy metal sensor [Deltaproteobacteria bacterium]
MKKLLFPLMVVALTLTLASPARAGKMRAEEKERGGRIEKRIEMLKAMRLSEELGLSEEESFKFYAILREHHEQKKELRHTIRELIEKLEEELERKNTKQMKALIEEIETKSKEMCELRHTHHSKLKELLSLEQQAKLAILMPRIEHEIRSTIRETIMERRGPKQRMRPMSPPPGSPTPGLDEPPPE